MKPQWIVLTNTVGSSNKIYQAQLEESGDGWIVNFQYGGIGRALTSGTKTVNPIDGIKALKLYDKLIASKLKKGYVPKGARTAQTVAVTKNMTHMLPQLLSDVHDLEDVQAFYREHSGRIIAQVKYDGERRGVQLREGDAYPIVTNRNSEVTAMNADVAKDLQKLMDADPLVLHSLELDCEDMGTWIVVFDILKINAGDLRDSCFQKRMKSLKQFDLGVRELGLYKRILVAEPRTFKTWSEFKAWILEQKALGHEGIVVRDMYSEYTAGIDPDCIKYKFKASATVYCEGQNGDRRSVAMSVRISTGDAYQFIGNCTIGGVIPMPKKGDFIEVEYLHAFPDGGSLYQPAYKGVRNDKHLADHYNSLKFKVVQTID